MISRKLAESGLEYCVHATRRPGDATLAVRTHLRQGCKTIAVIGGDGTLSEAAEGFFALEAKLDGVPQQLSPEGALAILPAGTGDDFARGLAGDRKPLEYWISIFLAHAKRNDYPHTRRVDVLYGASDGYTRPFICLNASTLGIGGETAARVATQGKLWRLFAGEVRFTAAALAALVGWRERRVRITMDDNVVIDSPMNLAAVANNCYTGGGMMLAPAARIDDGQLDVVTASGLTRLGIIRELTRIHSGAHVANPKIRIHQGQKTQIETLTPEDAMLIEVDGNLRGKTPACFRVMPAALRFIAGP